jgi:hypothetical protein
VNDLDKFKYEMDDATTMDDQLKVAQLFHKHVGLDSVGFRG